MTETTREQAIKALLLEYGKGEGWAGRAIDAVAPLLDQREEVARMKSDILDNIREYQAALLAHDAEKRKAWDELAVSNDTLDLIDGHLSGAKFFYEGDTQEVLPYQRDVAERVELVTDGFVKLEAERDRIALTLLVMKRLWQIDDDAGENIQRMAQEIAGLEKAQLDTIREYQDALKGHDADERALSARLAVLEGAVRKARSEYEEESDRGTHPEDDHTALCIFRDAIDEALAALPVPEVEPK